MVEPIVVTPARQTSAISATSSPYSIRSWPSSRCMSRLTAAIICVMTSPFLKKEERSRPPPLDRGTRRSRCASVLRAGRGAELGRDVAEDRVDVLAGERDGANGHQRDQRHEQRVFEQVLAGVVLKSLQTRVEFHHHAVFSARVLDAQS